MDIGTTRGMALGRSVTEPLNGYAATHFVLYYRDIEELLRLPEPLRYEALNRMFTRFANPDAQ